MRAIILNNASDTVQVVYENGVYNAIDQKFGFFNKIIGQNDLEQYKEITKKAEYVFSTWGMPVLEKEQIERYFPSAKALFYAAGSVQAFARPWLECGVAVCSAWKINAYPVAEFAVGCKTAADYDYETFQKTYTCEFGSLFSLPAKSYKGKSVVYEVKADGKTVEVFNNAFAVTVMADHDVMVKYKDGKTISRFTVIPKDAQAPEIFFDKTSFIACVGESFELPEITVTDNVDGKISNYTRKLHFNGKEIDFAKTVTPQAVGQYEYKVTATDGRGNKSEQSAYFPVKERENVHDTVFALNSDYGMTEQIKPVFGANFSVSEEIRYGDEPSYKENVRFPFGYGLSYAKFEYSAPWVKQLGESKFKIGFDITNVSDIAAKEVVQIYVGDVFCTSERPIKELKAFKKVLLAAGETKKIEINLDKEAFSFYNPAIGDWYIENGTFDIFIASSSQDIKLKLRVEINL